MRPVSQTPTEASDYALLSMTYGLPLAGTAASARGREPLSHAELPGAGGGDLHAVEADRPREGRDVDPPAVRR